VGTGVRPCLGRPDRAVNHALTIKPQRATMPAAISNTSTPVSTPIESQPPPDMARRSSQSDARPELSRAPLAPVASDAPPRPPRSATPVHAGQAKSRPEAPDQPAPASPPMKAGDDGIQLSELSRAPARPPAGEAVPAATTSTQHGSHTAATDLEISAASPATTAVIRRRGDTSRAASLREQDRLRQELLGRAEIVANVLIQALMTASDDGPRSKTEKRDKLTASEINAPDVQQRLTEVALVLAQELSISARDFSSMNEAVEAATRRYLVSARKSDVAIATLVTGIMKGIGYLIGMTDSNERAVEKMFKDHLNNAHTLGTFVGHYVSLYDVPLGLLGMGVAAGLHHVGTDSDLPDTVKNKINPAQDHIDDTRDAGVANLSKNSPRLVAPVLQSLIENGGKLGPITRKSADRADLSGIDGGGGVVASMAVEYRRLNRRYAQRLILNKPENVRHSVRRIEGKEHASAKRVAQAVLATFKAAPLTYLMLMLMVGPFIGRLFGANASIERDMGQGNNNGLPPDKVALGLVTSKRAGSTFDMFTMVTFLNYWAPVMAQMEARMWEKAGNSRAVKKFTDLLPDWGGSQVSLQRNMPTFTEV
ncbi:MAG TPA: hypothetical protein VEB23_04460, partial [Ramlibacter sp.]|nr:hypothetical protein [Ramlibacter sp.]